MKTNFFIKISILSIFMLLFIACNKEENKNTVQNANAYLSKFYKTKYILGKSSDFKLKKALSLTSKEVIYDDVRITEIIVGNDDKARGYLITSKETKEFLYFIDVDRDLLKMLTYDVKVNDTKEMKNIDQLQEWIKYNELDMIQVTNGYIQEMAQLSETEKRPFWGWGPAKDGQCGPNSNGDGGCSYGNMYNTMSVG